MTTKPVIWEGHPPRCPTCDGDTEIVYTALSSKHTFVGVMCYKCGLLSNEITPPLDKEAYRLLMERNLENVKD